MGFDPERHHRRSIRLKEYDYSQAGAYFVTICTHNREYLFGDIKDGEMVLNGTGSIVQSVWEGLPNRGEAVGLDAYVIMPNHMHGIIIIGRGEAFAGRNNRISSQGRANASPLHGTQPGSLGAIVQNFKSVSTRKINQKKGTSGIPLWQRNYYEHIIRSEKSLINIRHYIAENPLRWAYDEENPCRIQK